MAISDFYRMRIRNTTNQEIKEWIRQGKFTAKELLEEQLIDEKRFQEITTLSKEEHIDNLKQLKIAAGLNGNKWLSDLYTKEYITTLINDKVLTEFELKNQGIYTQDELNEILNRAIDSYDTGQNLFKTPPPPLADRTDVFVLGITGAGKTSFMAGILKHIKDKGSLDLEMLLDENEDALNQSGIIYAMNLVAAVETNRPVAPNIYEFVNYMAINLYDDNGRKHPLSFMEMSGEVFEQCYGKNKKDINSRLATYLFNDNQKILFCVVDYNVHHANRTLKDAQQWMHFQWFLQLLAKHSTLKRATAICILITKWDLHPDQSTSAAVTFLKAQYNNLYNTCLRYVDEFKLKFNIITFSLGHFDARNSITYKEDDSKKVVDWFCENTDYLDEKKGKKSWSPFQ